MTVTDLPLFSEPPIDASALPEFLVRPSTPIERSFRRFHAQNPRLYGEIEERALNLMRAGRKRIGIALIVEAVRYSRLETTGDRYKINNNFRALYARMLIHDHPELSAVLETRTRKEKVAQDAA